MPCPLPPDADCGITATAPIIGLDVPQTITILNCQSERRAKASSESACRLLFEYVDRTHVRKARPGNGRARGVMRRFEFARYAKRKIRPQPDSAQIRPSGAVPHRTSGKGSSEECQWPSGPWSSPLPAPEQTQRRVRAKKASDPLPI